MLNTTGISAAAVVPQADWAQQNNQKMVLALELVVLFESTI